MGDSGEKEQMFPDQGPELPEGQYLLEDDNLPISDHLRGSEKVSVTEICKEDRRENIEISDQRRINRQKPA